MTERTPHIVTGWEMIRLLIFLLAAGFGDTRNPSNASLPIWLLEFLFGVHSFHFPFYMFLRSPLPSWWDDPSSLLASDRESATNGFGC